MKRVSKINKYQGKKQLRKVEVQGIHSKSITLLFSTEKYENARWRVEPKTEDNTPTLLLCCRPELAARHELSNRSCDREYIWYKQFRYIVAGNHNQQKLRQEPTRRKCIASKLSDWIMSLTWNVNQDYTGDTKRLLHGSGLMTPANEGSRLKNTNSRYERKKRNMVP